MKKYKLGELVDVTRGKSLAGKFYATEGNLVRLTCGNFDYNNNCFKENTSKDNIYYTEKVEDKFILKKGDIITPLTEQALGLLGSTARIPESNKYIQSQDVALIKCKKGKLDDGFCYYLISSKTVKEQLSAAAQQTKIRHTSPDKIKDCTVFIPDLPEQERIAKVLSDIDSKIALNKKINCELETMAKEIYDYWFVQFDFPNEEGKPYKSSGGKMQWNDVLKCKIPVGWEVRKLSDIANITMGQSPQGSSYNENGEGTIFYQGCADFGERFPDVRVYTTEPGKFAKKGDILMSVRAPVGTVNIANEDCCIGRGLAAINSRIGSMMHLEFIIKDFKTTFDSKGGTTFSSITKDELYNLPVIEPDKKVLSKFEEICKPINFQLSTVNSQLKQLTKLRDELLPLLMNGQVLVKSDFAENKNIIKQMPNYYEKYNMWVKTHGLAARGTVDNEVLRAIFDSFDDDDK